jgi:hypothetical protein
MHFLPPFEVAEYQGRLCRAQRLMTERGLAALLITTEMNLLRRGRTFPRRVASD